MESSKSERFGVTVTKNNNSLLIIMLAESFFIGCRPSCQIVEVSIKNRILSTLP